MASNIEITIEGADTAKAQVDAARASVERLGQSAPAAATNINIVEQRLERLTTASTQSSGAMTRMQSALGSIRFAQAGQAIGNLARVMGEGPDSALSRASSLTTQFAGMGAAFGPWGAAVGGAIGLVSSIAREMRGATVDARAFRQELERTRQAEQQRSRDAGAEAFVEAMQAGPALTTAQRAETARSGQGARDRRIAEINATLNAGSTGTGLLAGMGAGGRNEARDNDLLAERTRLQSENAAAVRLTAEAEEELRNSRNRGAGGGGGGGGRSSANDALEAEKEKARQRDAAANAEYAAERERIIAAELAALQERDAWESELAAAAEEERQRIVDGLETARQRHDELAFAQLDSGQQRVVIEAELARIQGEIAGVQMAGVDTDAERLRLLELQNDEMEQQGRLARTNVRQFNTLQHLGEEALQAWQGASSAFGSTLAKAYDDAITGQEDFDDAFVRGSKLLLSQLGQKFIAEGIGASLGAIGAAFTNPPAAAGLAIEGAGKIALGVSLGAAGSAIQPPPEPQKNQKSETPARPGGEDFQQGGRQTVVINYQGAIITGGTYNDVGRQMQRVMQRSLSRAS